MNDTGPLLSTIASAGATIVAIVGGLLVTRYVTLDGEQQVARRRVAELRRELDTAIASRISADERFSAHEAEWTLDDGDVYKLLRERAIARLIWNNSPAETEPAAITLDDIQRQVDIRDLRKDASGMRALQAQLDFLTEETGVAVPAVYKRLSELDDRAEALPEWDEVREVFADVRDDAVWQTSWDSFKTDIERRRKEQEVER